MRAAKKKDTHAILCLGLIKEKENQGLPDHLKYKATPPAEYYVEAARLGNSDAFMLLPKALEPKITIGASAGSPEAKRILESVKKKSEYTVESPRVTEQYNNLLNHYTEGIYVSKGIPKTELSLRQKMPSN